MLTGILFIICVGLMWGGAGIIFSKVVEHKVPPPAFHAVSFTITTVYLLIFHVKWPVLLAGDAPLVMRTSITLFLSGVINTTGMVLMLTAMKRGHKGITWTIGQSAMVLPFLASVLIWHDTVPAIKYLAVVLVLVTLILLGASKPSGTHVKNDTVWLVMSFSVLVLVGVAQTLNTIPSRWPGWVDTANLRVLMMTLGALFIAVVFLIVRRIRIPRAAFVTGAVASVIGIVSQIMMFSGLDRMARAGILSVAYPLAVGICIISFALYSAVVMKEHFGAREIAGVIIGLAGIGLMAVS